MRNMLILIGLVTALLAGCTLTNEPASDPKGALPSDAEIQAGLIQDGRMIVEENCSTCHAVGKTGESIRTDAPALRSVLASRDIEALRADFREGIHVGADDMPDFDFGPLGTDAVIAYIESIQE